MNTQEKGKLSEEELCLYKALEIIRAGNNSEKMLREKLTKKGFSRNSVNSALETVKEKRFINDEKLLFRHAEYLAVKKLYGAYRIRIELYKKFGRDVTDEYFEAAISEIDFRGILTDYVNKNTNCDKEQLLKKIKRYGHTSADIIYILKLTKSI